MASFLCRSSGTLCNGSDGTGTTYNATTKQGAKADSECAGDGSDTIIFSDANITNGRYLHQTQLDMNVAIGENEKPKGNVNELQDTFLDTITWTLTGSVATQTGNTSVFQKVKEWLIEEKTDDVFTKGRFGLELDDVNSYNLVPTGTGATPEQPRGYVLTNWRWIRDGETSGKAAFVATLRFNGDIGKNTTSTKYDWTVNYS